MSVKQPRVRPGVPTGGEFAATVHAEPAVTLSAPAPNSETVIHDAVRDREEKMRALKHELDRIHLQGAVDSLRRAFPDAVELRADHAQDYRGKSIRGLRGVRLLDAAGNDATGGDDKWFYKGSPEHGMSPDYHLYLCREIHLDQELISEDTESWEYVIRLDRDYWKADQP